jgi:hypothetical protein
MTSRRGTENPLVTAGLVAAAGYICLCFLVQAAANLLVTWHCGSSTPSPFNPAAAVGLFAGRIDWIVRDPQRCDVGTGNIWWIVGPMLLILAALAVGSVLLWRRWKQSGAWLRQDILTVRASPGGRRFSRILEAGLSENEERSQGRDWPNRGSRMWLGRWAVPVASRSMSPLKSRWSSRVLPAQARAST